MRTSGLEPICRVALVVLNAGGNWAVLAWLGVPAAAAASVALVNVGAAVPSLASRPAYARVLAGSSLAMPLSWPATAAGAVVLVLEAAAAPFRRGVRVSVDPHTLTVIVSGGTLFLFPCGYNLGNFVFVHGRYVDEGGACPPGLVAHETGHTLNVAAFGSVFHFLGAIHENWGPPRGGAGSRAYAELVAESRRRAPGSAWLEAWPLASGS